MESICPNCGKHDDIYRRSGGALVCRACFVTETLLGSWLALPELRGPSADGALLGRECAEKKR